MAVDPRLLQLQQLAAAASQRGGGGAPRGVQVSSVNPLWAKARQDFARQAVVQQVAQQAPKKERGFLDAVVHAAVHPSELPGVAVKAVGYPARGVVSTVDEVADAIVSAAGLDKSGQVHASLGDWWKQINDPGYGFGTAWEEMDKAGSPTGQASDPQWAKRLIGFGGDVALDPLTYLGLGADKIPGAAGRLALGKKAVEHGMERGVVEGILRKGGRAVTEEADRAALGLAKPGLEWAGVRLPGTGGISSRASDLLYRARAPLTDTPVARLARRFGASRELGTRPLVEGALTGKDPIENLKLLMAQGTKDTQERIVEATFDRAVSGEKKSKLDDTKGIAQTLGHDPAHTEAYELGQRTPELQKLRDVTGAILEMQGQKGASVGKLTSTGGNWLPHIPMPEWQDALDNAPRGANRIDAPFAQQFDRTIVPAKLKDGSWKSYKLDFNGEEHFFTPIEGTIAEGNRWAEAEGLPKMFEDSPTTLIARAVEGAKGSIGKAQFIDSLMGGGNAQLFGPTSEVASHEVVNKALSKEAGAPAAKATVEALGETKVAQKAAKAEVGTATKAVKERFVKAFSEDLKSATGLDVEARQEMNKAITAVSKMGTAEEAHAAVAAKADELITKAEAKLADVEERAAKAQAAAEAERKATTTTKGKVTKAYNKVQRDLETEVAAAKDTVRRRRVVADRLKKMGGDITAAQAELEAKVAAGKGAGEARRLARQEEIRAAREAAQARGAATGGQETMKVADILAQYEPSGDDLAEVADRLGARGAGMSDEELIAEFWKQQAGAKRGPGGGITGPVTGEVTDPIWLTAEKGVGGKPMIADGHRRLAALAAVNPEAEVPVRRVRSLADWAAERGDRPPVVAQAAETGAQAPLGDVADWTMDELVRERKAATSLEKRLKIIKEIDRRNAAAAAAGEAAPTVVEAAAQKAATPSKGRSAAMRELEGAEGTLADMVKGNKVLEAKAAKGVELKDWEAAALERNKTTIAAKQSEVADLRDRLAKIVDLSPADEARAARNVRDARDAILQAKKEEPKLRKFITDRQRELDALKPKEVEAAPAPKVRVTIDGPDGLKPGERITVSDIPDEIGTVGEKNHGVIKVHFEDGTTIEMDRTAVSKKVQRVVEEGATKPPPVVRETTQQKALRSQIEGAQAKLAANEAAVAKHKATLQQIQEMAPHIGQEEAPAPKVRQKPGPKPTKPKPYTDEQLARELADINARYKAPVERPDVAAARQRVKDLQAEKRALTKEQAQIGKTRTSQIEAGKRLRGVPAERAAAQAKIAERQAGRGATLAERATKHVQAVEEARSTLADLHARKQLDLDAIAPAFQKADERVAAAAKQIQYTEAERSAARTRLDGARKAGTNQIGVTLDGLAANNIPVDPVTKSLFDAATKAEAKLAQVDNDVKAIDEAAKLLASGEATPIMERIAKDGFQLMSTDRLLGKDIYGSKKFVKMIDDYQAHVALAFKREKPGAIGKAFDAYNKFFKSWATASPGFHLRNAMSAIYMNMTEGTTAREMVDGVTIWKAWRQYGMRGLVKDTEGRLGESWLKELPERLRGKAEDTVAAVYASGAGGQFSAEELGQQAFGKGAARSKIGKFLTDNKALRFSRNTGEHVEGAVRSGLALHSLNAGESPWEAIARVKRIHFDYSEVNETDRAIRRAVPFWTFLSRNVPLQVQQMLLKPKMYAIYNHASQNLDVGGDVPLPGYLQAARAFRLAPNLAFNADIGPTQIAKQIQQLSNPKEMLSATTPLIKDTLQLVTNQDFFYGNQYKGNNYQKLAPEQRGPGELLGRLLGIVQNTPEGPVADKKYSDTFYDLIPALATINRLLQTTPNREGTAKGITASLNELGVPLRALDPKQMAKQANTSKQITARNAARDRKARAKALAQFGGAA